MKFKDAKTGTVYSDIESARIRFCDGRNCFDCPVGIRNNKSSFMCGKYTSDNPAEAALRMGYEVILDEDDSTMENVAEKPVLNWTVIDIIDWCNRQDGCKNCKFVTSGYKCKFMDFFPCRWAEQLVEAEAEYDDDVLTDEEAAICKASGAKYVTRDKTKNSELVVLWDHIPEICTLEGNYGGTFIAQYDRKYFPSVNPGDIIEIELEDENND